MRSRKSSRLQLKRPQVSSSLFPSLQDIRTTKPKLGHGEQRGSHVNTPYQFICDKTQKKPAAGALKACWIKEKKIGRRIHFSYDTRGQPSILRTQPAGQASQACDSCCCTGLSTLDLRFCSHHLQILDHFFEHVFPSPRALQMREPVLLAGDTKQSSHLCLHAEPAGCRLEDKQAGSSAQRLGPCLPS